MYAETELMFPQFRSFPQQVQQFDEYCCSQNPNASLDEQGNLIPTSTISEYYLQGDGDLFKAPEPVIEEPTIGIDPVAAAIFCGENGISPQPLIAVDIESSIENGSLLNEVFYECQKDLLAKAGDEIHLSEVLSIMSPVKTNENYNADENFLDESSFQKSISSSCLSSLENVQESPLKPSVLDFHILDFGDLNGIRRSFSEGDLKTTADENINPGKSPLGQPTSMSSTCPSEDRKEKLSRYRSKKSKRNFGRTIKYACRKALADSQPRIRGRFAKIE